MDRAATLAPRLARRLAAAGFAVLGTALPITGFSQLGPTDAGIGIKLGLAQRNNSGEVGDVTLVERGASTTLVIIRLAQEPDGRQQPAHIHRGRDCATLDPKPAYGLAPVIDGVSKTLVNAPIGKLLSGNYVVNVHASARNMTQYVSCGELYQ
jgi:hypothetical protein